MSLIGPILLLGLILQSARPPVKLVGLSTSPQGAFQNCFLLALFEGTAQSSGFCVICNLHSRTSSLSFVTLALSTTASVVSLCGISWRFSSAACARLANQLLSTVDARAEKFPSATQATIQRLSGAEAQDRLAVSETLAVRTIQAAFCLLSRSSLLIFPRYCTDCKQLRLHLHRGRLEIINKCNKLHRRHHEIIKIITCTACPLSFVFSSVSSRRVHHA